MGWRDVGTPAELGPGRYRLELGGPSSLLDQFVTHRDYMLGVADAAVRHEYPNARVTGGGVAHFGPNDRRLVLTVEVDEPAAAAAAEGGELQVAAFPVVAVAVAVIVSAIAAAWIVNALEVRRILQELPDGVIEDGAEGLLVLARTFRVLVLGGLGLGLLMWASGAGEGGKS